MGSSAMKRAEVLRVEPLYISLDGFALASGLAKKTLSNMLSRGELSQVVSRYAGTKRLFLLASVREWLNLYSIALLEI